MAHKDGIPGSALTRVAPAKVNLALHVVGQRADGYHLIESLVTFADTGDRIGFSPSAEDRFTVSGAFAGDVPLTDEGQNANLVLAARDLLRAHFTRAGVAACPVHLHLEKNLPVASGIGGGSADAAATLLGLMQLWAAGPGRDDLLSLALRLGADVPMCLDGRPLVATGIGETIEAVAGFPSFPMLLVNPGVAVSTPVIFRTLTRKTNPALQMPRSEKTPAAWMETLKAMRNDLEPPARMLEPIIGIVVDALLEAGAAFARMSGSGATCFALFASASGRDAAADSLSRRHPNWYVLACNSVNGEEYHHGRH